MQRRRYKIPVPQIPNIDVDGEQRPQGLLCVRILAADSITPNKLNRHPETVRAERFGKTPESLYRNRY
jgi:hypothetical protein